MGSHQLSLIIHHTSVSAVIIGQCAGKWRAGGHSLAVMTCHSSISPSSVQAECRGVEGGRVLISAGGGSAAGPAHAPHLLHHCPLLDCLRSGVDFRCLFLFAPLLLRLVMPVALLVVNFAACKDRLHAAGQQGAIKNGSDWKNLRHVYAWSSPSSDIISCECHRKLTW